jgi:hypothetical protein
MNYFAHGMTFIDQPYFLAGTAVPDWLNVVDRMIRVRREQLLPWADGSGSPTAQFAAGILKHLEDDEWFHKTKGFEQATREMAQSFRSHLENVQHNPRAAFLGHITTELLLDGVLIANDPRRLESYYTSLATIRPSWIEQTVSQITGRAVPSLARFCERFLDSRFLFDYLEAPKLLFRLNQVVGRIKLRPLPESTTTVITQGRRIVEQNLPDLLPADLFPFIQQLEENLP